MNKGLEALKDLFEVANLEQEIMPNSRVGKDFNIIEKELKQAQEDKEMLNIFKNALTIEHDLSTPSFTPLEKDKPFNASAIITETIKIKQNELDEKLRKSLREWVLKNAFPKELKRLEELEKAFDTLSKDDEKAKKLLSLEIEKNRALNEILALYDKWLGNEMSDFEFFTLLSEVKDKYGLSKEAGL